MPPFSSFVQVCDAFGQTTKFIKVQSFSIKLAVLIAFTEAYGHNMKRLEVCLSLPLVSRQVKKMFWVLVKVSLVQLFLMSPVIVDGTLSILA